MRPDQAIETLFVRALRGVVNSVDWQRSLALGARLGDVARRLGIRRKTAASNLELAFPERLVEARENILRSHYQRLGRVIVEYLRLGDLARRPIGEVIAEVHGMEHLFTARDRGRGAILLSGHFGNVELMGAFMGQSHSTDFVVRPLSNPGVEAMIARERARAGVGQIPSGSGVRRIYQALRENRWVAMLADQDARAQGAFVRFLGRPASTPIGPARIALATGAPIIMGFMWRQGDGRHVIEIEPPLERPEPHAVEAVTRLTELHVGVLERWVRKYPEEWFWLHRRWKTRPTAASLCEGVAPEGTSLVSI